MRSCRTGRNRRRQIVPHRASDDASGHGGEHETIATKRRDHASGSRSRPGRRVAVAAPLPGAVPGTRGDGICLAALGTERRPPMNEPTQVGAASLAEFVRATQDAEFDDGDAARVARLLANTKAAFAALADRPRFDFDAEPAEMAAALRRLAPAAASGAGAKANAGTGDAPAPARGKVPAPTPREARRDDLAGRALPLRRGGAHPLPRALLPRGHRRLRRAARGPRWRLASCSARSARTPGDGPPAGRRQRLPRRSSEQRHGLPADMLRAREGAHLHVWSGQQGHHREGARRRREAPPNLRCRSHPHLAGRAGRPPPQGRYGRPRVSVHPANRQVDVAVARLTIVIGAEGAGENTWRRANRRALPTHFYDADSIDQGLGSCECRYCSSEAVTMFVCQPVTSSGRVT